MSATEATQIFVIVGLFVLALAIMDAAPVVASAISRLIHRNDGPKDKVHFA